MIASDEDESASQHKRRRVSNACVQCRQSKLKCNGARPQCAACLKAKRTCSYEATVRRRGLKSGYVRALECLWGLLFQSIEGSEQTVERLIARTSKKAFPLRDEAGDSTKSGESPLETWKSSTVSQALNALLSDTDDREVHEGVTALADLHCQTDDVDLTWNWLGQSSPAREAQSYESIPASQIHRELNPALQAPNGTGAEGVNFEASTYSGSTLLQETPPELPPNAQRLLTQYFAITHSWLPILDRHAVYRTFFAYRKSLNSDDAQNWKSGENAVLWAIFAYTSTVHGPSCKNKPSASQHTLKEFYTTARGMLPLEIEDSFSVCHVQTLLILGLLHFACSEHRIARTLTGQAILLASHIELDERDKYPMEHHRRVWLGCFVLDTLTSISTGKAPRIRSQSARDSLLDEKSGHDEWEPWQLKEALIPGVATERAEFANPTHALTVFAELVDMLCIFNDCIFSNNQGQASDKYKQALSLWDKNTPEHIKTMMSTDVCSAPFTLLPPNILNLYAIYSLLDVTLSCAGSLAADFNWRPISKIMICGAEMFLRSFDPRTLPPPFSLLRHILPEMSRDSTISEVISGLRLKTSGNISIPSKLRQGSICESSIPVSVTVTKTPRHAKMILWLTLLLL